MGEVYTDITIENAVDVIFTEYNINPEQGIRRMDINVLVDTGASTLFINETMREHLGLKITGEKMVRLANDVQAKVLSTEPVIIHWKDRESVCRPWFFSGNCEALLGAIPLEDMDLIVDPNRGEVIGAHGNENIGKAVGVRQI